MNRVSVIIPTYNRVDSVHRAVESVLRQTRIPEQILVIDDGSEQDVTTSLHASFPGVEVIRQGNRGVSAARNLGIRHASGDWIALLDDDDTWLPEKLERQLQALQAEPDYRIAHSDEIWIRNGKRVNAMRKHAKHGGNIYRQCLPLCVISPSAVIIQRGVFEQLGMFNETLPACEDYDLWLRICAVYPVLFIDAPLIVKNGGHADQLSRKYWGMDRFRIQALCNMLEHGKLSPAHQQATLDMALYKIDIYIQGAAKRDKHEEVADYQSLREQLIDRHRPLSRTESRMQTKSQTT